MKSCLPTLEFMAELYLDERDEKDTLLSLTAVEYKLKKYMALLHGEPSSENRHVLPGVRELMETVIIPRLLTVNRENYERLTCYTRTNSSISACKTLLEKYRSFMDVNTIGRIRKEIAYLHSRTIRVVKKSA